MMDLLRDMKWPFASVIIALCATVFALVHWGGQSLKDIAWFIGALGVAYIGWMARLQARDTADIGKQVNGNNEALRVQVREALELVAAVKEEKAQMAHDNGRLLALLAANLPAGTPLPSALADEPTSASKP